MSKNKKGFTLIELLVVISIIALLSSVVMSSLNSARQKARKSYTIQTINQYINAITLAKEDPELVTALNSQNTQPPEPGSNNFITYSSRDSQFYNFISKYYQEAPTPSNLDQIRLHFDDEDLFYDRIELMYTLPEDDTDCVISEASYHEGNELDSAYCGLSISLK